MFGLPQFTHKYGKNFLQAIEAEGFSEKEFGKIHGTITEIWANLWQQQVSEVMGGKEGLAGLADQSISMMESMLNNPNLDAKSKAELQKQIKEAKASREDLIKKRQAQEQRLKKFSPQNVALVKEYMPKLMQVWRFKASDE